MRTVPDSQQIDTGERLQLARANIVAIAASGAAAVRVLRPLIGIAAFVVSAFTDCRGIRLAAIVLALTWRTLTVSVGTRLAAVPTEKDRAASRPALVERPPHLSACLSRHSGT